MGKELKAIRFVLFRSHEYKPGDVLPADDSAMVSSWIECGTAKWTEDTDEPSKTIKAVPTTAPVGRAGIAVPNSDNDLTGKVPEISARKKKK